MPRIAHLSDLHIGFSHLNYRDQSGRNQRQVDFERAALAAADHLVGAEPDIAVVAGDLLHETNMYPAAMTGAVSFCERLREAGIPLVAIGGNHDEAESPGRYNGLRFLAAHTGLDLHLDQSHLDIAGVRLHLVSFRVLSRAQGGRGELEPFQFSEDVPNVLVAHGYAPGEGVPEIPEGMETEIPLEWLLDPRFSLSLLGHIHHHGQIMPSVFYAGSTERRNFGEASERPGFWIHELDGGALRGSESVFIDELASDLPRPMIDRDIDTSGLTVRELDEEVLNIFDEIEAEGAMLRIALHNVNAELDRSRSQSSWEREFRRRGGFHFEATVRTRRVEELLSIEFAPKPADVAKGFLDFMAEQEFGDAEERKELLGVAGQVMSEARDRLIEQESD
jgi:DNA repair exonuclease SbcCD nuclease subunit